MNKVTLLPTDHDRSEPRRRVHLLDVTTEVSHETENVGAELQAARLRRGEDVRSIAQFLRIRRDQLEALEESRYEALPARAYAIGFVRSYAEYLGLDSRHVVERYKAELDGYQGEVSVPKGFSPAAAAPQQEYRLPKGTALIVALVVGAGIYGGWLLTKSTDEMISSRPAPASVATTNNGGSTLSLRGDVASAATPPARDLMPRSTALAPEAGAVQGNAGQITSYQPESVYEPQPEGAAVADTPDVVVPATEQPLPAVVAAITPAAAPVGSEVIALPPLLEGTHYGAENVDGRVVLRARRDGAWVRIEDGLGEVLLERTLNAGDTYRAPSRPGVILVARDASAFEIIVDGQSLGLAGPSSLVLTGKSLNRADLLASLPQKPVAEAEPADVEGAQTATN